MKARRTVLIRIALIVLFAGALAAAYFVIQPQQTTHDMEVVPREQTLRNAMDSSDTIVSLTAGEQTFRTVVVQESAALQRGLSDSAPLEQNEAMLFVFSQSDKHGFWMKDMNYPIDIIWIDEAKKVISVKAHADPSSYSQVDEQSSEIFKPASEGRYVLETAAGVADKYGISAGVQTDFTLPERAL